MTHQLTIIGLGNYGLDELPVSIYKLIQQQAKIYVRTKNHPVIAQLEGIAIESFDDVYEAHETFEPVYQAITERLFEYAQHEDIVYAVPGHPRVAETTTQLLLQNALKHNVAVKG